MNAHRPDSFTGLAVLALAASMVVLLLLWSAPAAAAEAAKAPPPAEAIAWGYLAAAIATGLSSLGAGFAVARLGTAAVGTLAEKPELVGRLLIFVGLAEGIAIYGVIISILILERLS